MLREEVQEAERKVSEFKNCRGLWAFSSTPPNQKAAQLGETKAKEADIERELGELKVWWTL